MSERRRERPGAPGRPEFQPDAARPDVPGASARPKGPDRPPRVTDDDEDDGLAGAPVPRHPIPPVLSGAAAAAVPSP